MQILYKLSQAAVGPFLCPPISRRTGSDSEESSQVLDLSEPHGVGIPEPRGVGVPEPRGVGVPEARGVGVPGKKHVAFEMLV